MPLLPNQYYWSQTKMPEAFNAMTKLDKINCMNNLKLSNCTSVLNKEIFHPGSHPNATCCIINPGSIYDKDKLKVIYRGERTDASFGGYLMTDKAYPLVGDGVFKGSDVMFKDPKLFDSGMPASCRAEDWRLFKHKDKIYTNFSNYYYLDRGFPQKTVRCSMGVGLLLEKRIQFVRESDPAKVNIPTQKLEKNWAFFSHAGNMFAVYSIEPWIVLKFDDSASPIDFKKKDIHIDRLGDSYLACSTNPIEVELKSIGPVYLMFLHQYFYPSEDYGSRKRTYYQHLLAISKKDLTPIAWTPRPVIGGGISSPGKWSGVVYISSCFTKGRKLHALAGEGDSYCSHYIFDLDQLEEHFTLL